MKYVVVMGQNSKIIAVGEILSYEGKWIKVMRNHNEIVIVNTDFVQSVHFMHKPSQKMLDMMNRTDEGASQSPMAVKQASGRIDRNYENIGNIVQQIINDGPPNMHNTPKGVNLSDLPSSVLPPGKVPDWAVSSDDEMPDDSCDNADQEENHDHRE